MYDKIGNGVNGVQASMANGSIELHQNGKSSVNGFSKPAKKVKKKFKKNYF